jgi:hypothetical protein
MDKHQEDHSEFRPTRSSSVRRAQRRNTKNLLIRNVLNGLFMLLAMISMLGLWLFPEHTTQCYILCLIAVCVKMVEVMFRMPGMKK